MRPLAEGRREGSASGRPSATVSTPPATAHRSGEPGQRPQSEEGPAAQPCNVLSSRLSCG